MYRNELLPGSVFVNVRTGPDGIGPRTGDHMSDLRAVDDGRSLLEKPLHRYRAASLEGLARRRRHVLNADEGVKNAWPHRQHERIGRGRAAGVGHANRDGRRAALAGARA